MRDGRGTHDPNGYDATQTAAALQVRGGTLLLHWRPAQHGSVALPQAWQVPALLPVRFTQARPTVHMPLAQQICP
jgi:hypothetical protein